MIDAGFDAGRAGERLVRKLERSAEVAGCTLDVVTGDSQRLSCGVFDSALHWLKVSVSGSPGRAWLETLDEYSIHVPGFVLAQLAVGAIDDTGGQLLAEIEAQMVKEA